MAEKVVVDFIADVDAYIESLDEAAEAAIELEKQSIDSAKTVQKQDEAIAKARNRLLKQEEANLKRLKAARKNAIGLKDERALDAAIRKSEASLKSYEKQLGKVTKRTKTLNRETEFFKTQLKTLGASVVAAFSVQALISFANQATKLASELQSVQISLNFIEGNARDGAETMEFLRRLTEEFGLELVSTTRAFRQFSGAARLAGVSSGETREIFESVSTAVAAMGLSAQDADRVFLALSQIISKGVVSSEELRRQLGDALPGAFSIAAQSMKLTEAEFNKLLETGQIISSEFLPGFAKQLRDTFEEGAVEGAKSLNARINRLQNSITELTLQLGNDLAPAWLTVQEATLTALAAAVQYAKFGPTLFSGLGTAAEVIRETATAAEDVGLRVEAAAKRYEEAGIKASQARGLAIDDELRVLEDNFKKREAIVKQYEDLRIERFNALSEAEREQTDIKDLLTDKEQQSLKIAELKLQATDNELNAIRNLRAELDAQIAKENEVQEVTEETGEKKKRALLDEIFLRQQTDDQLEQLAKREIEIGDEVTEKNLKRISKEYQERFKLWQSLLNQFEQEVLILTNQEREILFKFRIESDAAAVGPEQAFFNIRDELFKTFQAEKSQLETLNSARVATAIEGLTNEEDIAAARKEVNDKTTAQILLAWERYLARIKQATEQLGLFQSEEAQMTSDQVRGLWETDVEAFFIRNQEILRLSVDLTNQLLQLSQELTQGRINDLERQKQSETEYFNERLDQIEEDRSNRLISEEEFTNRHRELKDAQQKVEEAYDARIRRLRRNQAVAQKLQATFSIILDTATAVTEALPNIPLSIIIAALGAAQLATVAAQPIPKFKLGTKNKSTSGLAEVGEAGREIIYLPSGTKVLPNDRTEHYAPALDSMYDYTFDKYVHKNFVAPELEKQRREMEIERTTINNTSVTPAKGLSFYDLVHANKRGTKMTNVKELARAIAEALRDSETWQ